MAASVTVQVTEWLQDLSSKLVRAQVRLHHSDVLEPDMAVIFVANHFTRLEPLLLLCLLQEQTGPLVKALAPVRLFRGRISRYLKATGTVSSEAPDKDRTVIRPLLLGEHPWILFPETPLSATAQDTFSALPRPLHADAAALALRTAYYRAKFRCPCNREPREDMDRALQQFALETPEQVKARRTVIIPLSVTYYPIRRRENLFLRAAAQLGPHLNERALAELSVENTALAENMDIDVTFGEPLDMGVFLNQPEHASIMACKLSAFDTFESNPGGRFQAAARTLTGVVTTAVRSGVSVNFDHLFAGLIKEQPEGRLFKERDYRERLYLSALQAQKKGRLLHPALLTQCNALLDDEKHPPFQDFLRLAVAKKYLIDTGWGYRIAPEQIRPLPGLSATTLDAAREALIHEFAAAHIRASISRYVAWAPDFVIKAYLRRHLLHEDLAEFEEDYARFYHPRDCKPPDVGRPFLLCPWRIRGGVVLAHGYMAAPLEVRALAEHLRKSGFAVYGIRLRGHGTAPEDLARQEWETWYRSLNRGYAIMRTLTDNIVVGGFSTGGCLALLAAARKKKCFSGVFSICAPLYVRNYSIRLVPSLISLNSLLKRFGQSQFALDYVENNPENKHINYTRNPLTGVRQLTAIMHATADVLTEINIPALVIQASKDTTVDPSSGPDIFENIGTRQKQFCMFERDRHGIINGEGSPDIFAQVEQFLQRTAREASAQKYWLFGRRVGQLLSSRLLHPATSATGSGTGPSDDTGA